MTSPSSNTTAELVPQHLLDGEVGAALELLAAAKAPQRLLIGIAGPPGGGKSTVTEALRDAINARVGGPVAAIVPMDGFHLYNDVLVERGIRDRKGAPDTFDSQAFVDLLVRVKGGEAPLPVPIFSHNQGNPVPGGIVLKAENRIALVEGNYLYLKSGAWRGVAPLLDRRLFLAVDREECRRRLVPRHIASGKTEEHARRHVETVDLKNYDLIYADLDRTENIVYDNG
jgi:pantothenate kinase